MRPPVWRPGPFTPHNTPVPASPSKIIFANQLRGLCVLGVMLVHYTVVATYMRDAVAWVIAAPILPRPAFDVVGTVYPPWFDLGKFGVGTFFLISGFVIPFSLRRATPLRFLAARALRHLSHPLAGIAGRALRHRRQRRLLAQATRFRLARLPPERPVDSRPARRVQRRLSQLDAEHRAEILPPCRHQLPALPGSRRGGFRHPRFPEHGLPRPFRPGRHRRCPMLHVVGSRAAPLHRKTCHPLGPPRVEARPALRATHRAGRLTFDVSMRQAQAGHRPINARRPKHCR